MNESSYFEIQKRSIINNLKDHYVLNEIFGKKQKSDEENVVNSENRINKILEKKEINLEERISNDENSEHERLKKIEKKISLNEENNVIKGDKDIQIKENFKVIYLDNKRQDDEKIISEEQLHPKNVKKIYYLLKKMFHFKTFIKKSSYQNKDLGINYYDDTKKYLRINIVFKILIFR